MLVLLRGLSHCPLWLLHAVGALLGWLTWAASPSYRRRLRENAGYNELRANLLYGGGAEGYTDYPTLDAAFEMLSHRLPLLMETLAKQQDALALSSDETELFVAATDGDTIPTQADSMAKSFVHQAIAVSVQETAMDYGLVGALLAELERQGRVDLKQDGAFEPLYLKAMGSGA